MPALFIKTSTSGKASVIVFAAPGFDRSILSTLNADTRQKKQCLSPTYRFQKTSYPSSMRILHKDLPSPPVAPVTKALGISLKTSTSF